MYHRKLPESSMSRSHKGPMVELRVVIYGCVEYDLKENVV